MAEHATVAVEDVRFLLITLQHHIREMLHLPARPTSLSRGSNPMRPHVRSEVLAIGGCTAFRSKGPNSEPVHSGIFVGPFAAMPNELCLSRLAACARLTLVFH